MISVQKAKHLDVTTMFTYSYANTPLDQSEHTNYINKDLKINHPNIKVTQHINGRYHTLLRCVWISSDVKLKTAIVSGAGSWLGGGCRECAPRPPSRPSEMTCGFLIQLVFCIKISLSHQSVTLFLRGAPPPKKNPGCPPGSNLQTAQTSSLLNYLSPN